MLTARHTSHNRHKCKSLGTKRDSKSLQTHTHTYTHCIHIHTLPRIHMHTTLLLPGHSKHRLNPFVLQQETTDAPPCQHHQCNQQSKKQERTSHHTSRGGSVRQAGTPPTSVLATSHLPTAESQASGRWSVWSGRPTAKRGPLVLRQHRCTLNRQKPALSRQARKGMRLESGPKNPTQPSQRTAPHCGPQESMFQAIISSPPNPKPARPYPCQSPHSTGAASGAGLASLQHRNTLLLLLLLLRRCCRCCRLSHCRRLSCCCVVVVLAAPIEQHRHHGDVVAAALGQGCIHHGLGSCTGQRVAVVGARPTLWRGTPQHTRAAAKEGRSAQQVMPYASPQIYALECCAAWYDGPAPCCMLCTCCSTARRCGGPALPAARAHTCSMTLSATSSMSSSVSTSVTPSLVSSTSLSVGSRLWVLTKGSALIRACGDLNAKSPKDLR